MQGSRAALDPALPSLTAALDATVMADRLGALLAPGVVGSGWRVVGIELLKHKPGRRCALAYTVEGLESRRRFFAKTFKNDRGAAILEHTKRIAEALGREKIFVPRPIGYLPELRMLVTEFVEGRSLATALYDGDSDEPAQRMAQAAARLHGCGVRGLRPWATSDELEITARWVAELDGDRQRRAMVLMNGLNDRKVQSSRHDHLPIHRDFYPDQIMDADGDTAVLDLDDVRGGDPAVDLGNFLAHLTLRSLQFPKTYTGCRRARSVFLRSYAGAHARSGENGGLAGRVLFYEAASLLRLSGVYGVRERWAATLPPVLLEACERLLGTRGER